MGHDKGMRWSRRKVVALCLSPLLALPTLIACADDDDEVPRCMNANCSVSAATGSGGSTGSSTGSNGIVVWSNGFGDGADQFAEGVATLGDGGTYVAGWFSGTLDFGTVSLTAPSGVDMFLVRFDPEGNAIWAHAFGQARDSIDVNDGMAVAPDGAGNVYFASTLVGDTSLSPNSDDVLTHDDSTEAEPFVVKLDLDGNLIWARNFAPTSTNPTVRDLDVDDAGNVCLSGDASGSGVLLDSPLDFGHQAFAACLAGNDGDTLWEALVGHSFAGILGHGIAVRPDGGAVLVGTFNATITIDGVETPTFGDQSDTIFVVAYDDAGAVEWSSIIGDAQNQTGRDVAIDDDGNIYIVGAFLGSLDFGGAAIDSTDNTHFDAYVGSLDASGGMRWALGLGNESPQVAVGVSAGTDHIAIVGSFQGNLLGATASANDDMWLLGLDFEGNQTYLKRVGGTGQQRGADVHHSHANHVGFVGNVGGVVEVTGMPDYEATGLQDAFVGVLVP